MMQLIEHKDVLFNEFINHSRTFDPMFDRQKANSNNVVSDQYSLLIGQIRTIKQSNEKLSSTAIQTTPNVISQDQMKTDMINKLVNSFVKFINLKLEISGTKKLIYKGLRMFLNKEIADNERLMTKAEMDKIKEYADNNKINLFKTYESYSKINLEVKFDWKSVFNKIDF